MKVFAISDAPQNVATVFKAYQSLSENNRRGNVAEYDLAAKFSPLPTYQNFFRSKNDYGETAEFFDLLREKLQGRAVEWGEFRLNALVDYAEIFYFYGSFRSATNIQSPTNDLWVQSQKKAWIDRVVSTRNICILANPKPGGRLWAAW